MFIFEQNEKPKKTLNKKILLIKNSTFVFESLYFFF
ncbi:Hypothetical Protein SLY_0673 [Strawberry lethal yellows phytoplasma (CPA) str. NZSb11]|uniref:Uncharacterized protein n=1 Tax=Strawberry lethal yellows phytoplasma (CPA) str. NZSb11 TaxID=980422 RepID=R4RXG7_PHYAS|nr:Hypothetical Protein SLY_0673 [Strawberry lethal yellows phytoplasma (CPA) str. NZSb11]